jgi:hypothetical protein
MDLVNTDIQTSRNDYSAWVSMVHTPFMYQYNIESILVEVIQGNRSLSYKLINLLFHQPQHKIIIQVYE